MTYFRHAELGSASRSRNNFGMTIAIMLAFVFPLNATTKPLSEMQQRLPEIESKITEAHEIFKIPGLAVAIVEGNKVIYAKGFGVRSTSLEDPVTPTTIFQIGSLSKGFTATLIAKLMGEGKLDWNQPVKSYLPEFEFETHKLTDNLTLKDILAHRSGLPSYTGDHTIQRGKYYVEALNVVKETPPFSPIGQTYSYQNVLYCLTDQILQKHAHDTWEKAIIKHLFVPMNLTHASTELADLLKNSNTAKPHVTGRAGALELPWSSFGYRVPCAGGLNMNVMDLASYLILHLNEGIYNKKQIIPAHLIREIHTPQVSTKGREPRHYRTYYHPKERVKETGYGLGFRSCDWSGHKVIGHGGYVRGQLSSITLIPDKKLGLAILSNAASTLPSVIRAHFVDMSLGLDPIDWLGREKAWKEKSDNIAKNRKVRKAKRKARMTPKDKRVKPKGDVEKIPKTE